MRKFGIKMSRQCHVHWILLEEKLTMFRNEKTQARYTLLSDEDAAQPVRHTVMCAWVNLSLMLWPSFTPQGSISRGQISSDGFAVIVNISGAYLSTLHIEERKFVSNVTQTNSRRMTNEAIDGLISPGCRRMACAFCRDYGRPRLHVVFGCLTKLCCYSRRRYEVIRIPARVCYWRFDVMMSETNEMMLRNKID